jgi:DNA-binding CsgD family transcriptional regulator
MKDARVSEEKRTSPLSPREQECLRLLAQGKRLKDVSAELGVAVKTIEKFVTSAKKKLGARTRDHMIAIAVTKGLL